MDQENHNTQMRVHLIDMPAPVTTFRQSVLDLTGLDCNGDVCERAAAAMRACLMSDAEILAVMYLRAVSCLQRTLTQTLTRAHEDKPLSVFDAAQQLRSDAQVEFVRKIEQLKTQFEQRTPPRFATPEFVPVRLNADCKYTLTSDARNECNVTVLVGTEGAPTSLAPGKTLAIAGTDLVEVMADQPCLLDWARVGGAYRTGQLRDCLPLPRLRKTQLPTPVAPKRKKFLGLF